MRSIFKQKIEHNKQPQPRPIPALLRLPNPPNQTQFNNFNEVYIATVSKHIKEQQEALNRYLLPIEEIMSKEKRHPKSNPQSKKSQTQPTTLSHNSEMLPNRTVNQPRLQFVNNPNQVPVRQPQFLLIGQPGPVTPNYRLHLVPLNTTVVPQVQNNSNNVNVANSNNKIVIKTQNVNYVSNVIADAVTMPVITNVESLSPTDADVNIKTYTDRRKVFGEGLEFMNLNNIQKTILHNVLSQRDNEQAQNSNVCYPNNKTDSEMSSETVKNTIVSNFESISNSVPIEIDETEIKIEENDWENNGN